jgi:hypothetical protein
MGFVSDQLRNMLEKAKNEKVIDIEVLRRAQEQAKRDREDIEARRKKTAGIHPFHAVYVSAQDLVMIFMEHMTGLSPLKAYAARVMRSQDDYQPGYPPMSPVTLSFFNLWAFFDVRFGPEDETIGTCFLDLAPFLGFDEGTMELAHALADTRMGLFVHEGADDTGAVRLREIYTQQRRLCHSASGYPGKEGEIWFVRLAPPPFGLGDLHTALTTPYVMRGVSEKDWEGYFERVLPRLKIDPPVSAHGELMKYGLTPDYWNEYVFQAYSGHLDTAVFLAGLPDRPESLPHFDPAPGRDLSRVKTSAEKKAAEKKARRRLKKGM